MFSHCFFPILTAARSCLFQCSCESSITSAGGAVCQLMSGLGPKKDSLQHNQKNKLEIHQKRKEKHSDLQSEDEVEIFRCRSCLSHHPPQTCSCSSWRGEAAGLTVQSQPDYEQPAPILTPPCRCGAGALAFLWCVSCGSGWSWASPAARPILHLCNHNNNKSP